LLISRKAGIRKSVLAGNILSGLAGILKGRNNIATENKIIRSLRTVLQYAVENHEIQQLHHQYRSYQLNN
jgi:hypothetical protein